MEAAMRRYAELGVHTLKTGYAGGFKGGYLHHSQYGVQHYQRVVETAAKYRTMAKMLSELIRWGRHYNQAVRALNTIALFIRRGSPPEYRAFSEMLSDAEEKLAEVERGRQVIEYVLTDIAGSTSVSGD